jgi:hypothetical protein
MHKLIEEYLIHSYLYYILDTSVISDTKYDMLCKRLLESGIEHPLVDQGDLAAGTGYSIKDYPAEIIWSARELLESAPKAAGGGTEEHTPLIFTGNEMETYLLCGMYIDFGMAKQQDRQDEIKAELQRRWDEKIHLEEFQKYFDSWGLGPERFGLNG